MRTAIVPKILPRALLLITMLLACFWLQDGAQAANPPPDGGYRGANTAEGSNALFNLTSGNNNTALGSEALLHLQDGSQNTAVGAQALKNNYHPGGNTAVGFQTLVRNNNGGQNTGTGWRALFTNTAGTGNTADGYGALYSNTLGSQNTASGFQALYGNLTGSGNTAVGYQANLGGGMTTLRLVMPRSVRAYPATATQLSASERFTIREAMTTRLPGLEHYRASTVMVTRRTVRTP